MHSDGITHVQKACAYVTRNGSELLVFEGPGYDGLQIPKGTIERGESPREALYREVIEESGVATLTRPQHLVTDVWKRRDSKRYVRSFFHVRVHEPRDEWTHTVTGTGDERGAEFNCYWVDLPANGSFALDLDDYLHALPAGELTNPASGVVAD
jgi:ADP-ribose pyrophosphatase YjhB (NUDIX family)